MIGTIEQQLCDLADRYKESNQRDRRQAVQICLQIIHQVWKDAENTKIPVLNKNPFDEIDEFALSIDGIEVYYDPNDNRYLYELDGLHFDSPREVIKYLIEYHKGNNAIGMYEGKMQVLSIIKDEIEKMHCQRPNTGLRNVKRAKITILGEEQNE